MSRGARLEGFATLDHLHSSEVIARDTSSVTMFNSILPGALESCARGSHVGGGPEEDGCGGQVVQEVVEQHPFQVVHILEDNDVCLFVSLPEGWKHPQSSLEVVTLLRAEKRKQ